MKIQFYKIKASLKMCVMDDFFYNKRLVENSSYYIKNYQGEFYGTFLIDDVYNSVIPEENFRNEKYYKNMLQILLANNLIYKLCEYVNYSEFTCNFYLKTAVDYELFVSASSNQLIFNKTYYCLNAENNIVGPFQIKQNDSGEKLRDFLDKGLLLVPMKKQLFEPISNAKAS